jgi:hypothetical protein
MSPDQLALAQLELAKLQTWITAVAIVLGPLAGVIFTLWFQKRKERSDAQHRLFLALMAHRRSMPPSVDWVNALNLIDVVFADSREVVGLWHQFYDLLCQDPPNSHLADAKYLDLLASMGRMLGYQDLSQTDISKFYLPRAHGNQSQLAMGTQMELLRVLRSTERINVQPRDQEKA